MRLSATNYDAESQKVCNNCFCCVVNARMHNQELETLH